MVGIFSRCGSFRNQFGPNSVLLTLLIPLEIGIPDHSHKLGTAGRPNSGHELSIVSPEAGSGECNSLHSALITPA
jgi:hypothetical protein